MRIASVPFQSSKWMQQPGKTSCAYPNVGKKKALAIARKFDI
jgi:hypothetical protein